MVKKKGDDKMIKKLEYFMVLNNCVKFKEKLIEPFSSYHLETVRDGQTDRPATFQGVS